MGIVRHALTFIGGILIAKGLVDAGVASQIIGGVMTLTGTVWSILDK